MEKDQTKYPVDSSQLLSFKSRQEKYVLYLETNEKNVIDCSECDDEYDITTVRVTRIGEFYYSVSIDKLLFTLNDDEYSKLIEFFHHVKEQIAKKQCTFKIKLFGCDVYVSDVNWKIHIEFENVIRMKSIFSRYIFADVVKYLEMMK